MRRRVMSGVATLVVCLAVFASAPAAQAQLLADTGWVAIGSIHRLRSTVTWIDNLYKYEYQFEHHGSPSTYIVKLAVANSYALPYIMTGQYAPYHDNAGVVSPNYFLNPTQSQVGWTTINWDKDGAGMPGVGVSPWRTITYGYYSTYGYTLNGIASAKGSGPTWYASAITMVPEPASVLGLGVGLCGVAGALLRKRRVSR